MRDFTLNHLPDALAIAGVAAILYGLALLATWLAWIITGVILLLAAAFAAAAERRRTRSPQ